MISYQTNPLVSIIIPVYNGSNFVEQAIESAINQTYKNTEVIVINDGSDDGDKTRNICLSYKTRIRYYEKENGGVSSALNLGIKKMKGSYVSWLSHDDIYAKNKIEKQVSEMMKHEKNTILYSNHGFFIEDNNNFELSGLPNIKPNDFRYWITVENSLHGCTLLIPKSAFDEHGFFDVSVKTTSDYAMWFKLAKNYQFLHVKDTFVFARIHKNQGTNVLSDIIKKECDELIINFINQLDNSEIMRNASGNLSNGYLKIAKSCRARGFSGAYLHAINLYKKHLSIFKKMMRLMKLHNENGDGIVNKLFFYIKIFNDKLKRINRKIFLISKFNKKLFNKNKVKKYDVNSVLLEKNLETKFTKVYENNLFEGNDSRSGEGSGLFQTKVIRKEIVGIIKKYNIRTLMDAPCGDWNWMKHVDFGLNQYIGVDIVEEVINKNNDRYGNRAVVFQKLNIVEDALPKTDLILSRDFLVHLSYQAAINAIKNFKNSGAKYLMITTFTNRDKNLELDNLFWRTLNMQIPPFNFPNPIVLINENCTEGNGDFKDKCLGLWALDDINI